MGEGSIARLAIAAALGILLAGVLRESAAGIVLPLLAAYLGARALRPSALWLSRRCRRIPEKNFCAAYAVLTCGALLYGLTALSGKLMTEFWSLTGELPAMAEEASELLASLYERLLANLPEGLHDALRDSGVMTVLPTMLKEAASSAGSAAAGVLASVMQKIPGGLLSAFAAVAGFVWLTADPDGAGKSLLSLLPDELAERVSRGFGKLSEAIFDYVRAYAVLMALTFGELAAGLTLLRVKNALAGALLIAVIDALPVLGCGLVLVPWAAGCFLTHAYGRGIGLLALTGVVWIVRQFAEPKIVGKAAGLHPFAALVCIFAGWKLGGVGGMIAVPVIVMGIRKVKSEK